MAALSALERSVFNVETAGFVKVTVFSCGWSSPDGKKAKLPEDMVQFLSVPMRRILFGFTGGTARPTLRSSLVKERLGEVMKLAHLKEHISLAPWPKDCMRLPDVEAAKFNICLGEDGCMAESAQEWLIGQIGESTSRASPALHMSLPMLLELLRRGCDAAKEGAVRVLRHASGHFAVGNRVLLRQSSAIALLVRVLQGGHAPAKQQAAAALASLVTGCQANAQKLIEAGGVAALVELLHSGPEKAKVQAASALRAISTEDASWNSFHRAGGIPVLLALLHIGSDEIKTAVAGVLSNLVNDGTATSQLVAGGAVPLLVSELKSGTAAGKGYAAAALCRVARLADYKVMILKAGAVPLLEQLAREKSSQAWWFRWDAECALKALSSEDLSTARSVAASGG